MKIVEKRKIFYGISLSVILLGLIFMAYYKIGLKQDFFNFGIEFKGGTVMNVDLGVETNIEEVKDLVYGITNDKNAQVQEVIDSNQVIIKLATKDDNESKQEEIEDVVEVETSGDLIEVVEENYKKDNDEIIAKVKESAKSSDSQMDLVYKALELKYGIKEDAVVELSEIDATIGDEMTANAVTSVLLACLAILVYVSFRFNDTKMGIAAIIALLQDVSVVLAVYAIFRLPIGNSFIAAMLTIVGYSINNTIVIFDRIRENIKANIRTHKDILVNTSVKETMTRTVNTSLTTLLSITALYFIGVDSIKEFTLPLIAGILAGTYSSVTISGPIWYDLIHIGKKKHHTEHVESKDKKAEKDEEIEEKLEDKKEKKITKNPKKAAKKTVKNASRKSSKK